MSKLRESGKHPREYGLIEWTSRKYPHKRYNAVCFAPEMYLYVLMLVRACPDYHTITTHTRLAN